MNRKKKIMLATLPALALVALGSSVASAHMGAFKDLTEEQRSALEEARQLRREGDKEKAKEVLKGAGLNPGAFHRRAGHHGEGMTDAEHEAIRLRHEAVETAIESNDFGAFKKAVADAPFADMVTEENFAKLVEAHSLKEAGDHEGALEVLRGIGFPGRGHGMEEGRGMHDMMEDDADDTSSQS